MPRLSRSEDLYYPAVSAQPLPREPVTKYWVLFLLTALSTTFVGQGYYAGYLLEFSSRELDISAGTLFLNGLWYSVPVLAILGAHEFGHYFACRYYRVDASLPYFLPMPLFLFGTLGAVIRIRQPIPGKRELFDIGIAGPIAGFLVAVPVLFLGMSLSKLVQMPEQFEGGGVEFGEPLLFKAVAWLTFGGIPEGQTLVAHPLVFAALFGLLATALNLFPIGQLDGGHISYAVLGNKSTRVTLVTVAGLVALSFISLSWILWTVVIIGMLLMFGPNHPTTPDEHVPLDRTRLWLAASALLMFALCFTPAPIEPLDLVTRP